MTAQVASLLILFLAAPPGSKLPKVEVGQRAFNQGDFEAALRAMWEGRAGAPAPGTAA